MTFRDGLTADELDAAAIACGSAALQPNADRFTGIAEKLYAEAERRREKTTVGYGLANLTAREGSHER